MRQIHTPEAHSISGCSQSVIVGVPAVAGAKQSMSIVDLASMKDTPIVVEPDVAWQRVAR